MPCQGDDKDSTTLKEDRIKLARAGSAPKTNKSGRLTPNQETTRDATSLSGSYQGEDEGEIRVNEETLGIDNSFMEPLQTNLKCYSPESSNLSNLDLETFTSSQNSQMSTVKYPIIFERSKILIEFDLQFSIYPDLSQPKKSLDQDSLTILLIIGSTTIMSFQSNEATINGKHSRRSKKGKDTVPMRSKSFSIPFEF